MEPGKQVTRDISDMIAHPRRLLNLVADVDFPKLFKKAEKRKVKLLAAALRQTRIGHVHQLQNPKQEHQSRRQKQNY